MPRQNSTGVKASPERIAKRSYDYLRTLLIQGAKSAVMSVGQRSDRISCWLLQLTERVGWEKAVGAPANTNARIPWEVLTRGAPFNPDHVPESPAARCCPKPHPAWSEPRSQTTAPSSGHALADATRCQTAAGEPDDPQVLEARLRMGSKSSGSHLGPR